MRGMGVGVDVDVFAWCMGGVGVYLCGACVCVYLCSACVSVYLCVACICVYLCDVGVVWVCACAHTCVYILYSAVENVHSAYCVE